MKKETIILLLFAALVYWCWKKTKKNEHQQNQTEVVTPTVIGGGNGYSNGRIYNDVEPIEEPVPISPIEDFKPKPTATVEVESIRNITKFTGKKPYRISK